MTLVIEFFGNLLSLNLQWFVELIMNNLLWFFFFILLTFVYHDMKWQWKTFFVIIFYVHMNIYFIPALGLAFLVGGFFFLNYMTRIIILTFAENIEGLKNKLPLILALQFFAALLYYNFFMV